MTIAAAYVSPEGVVLGADSAVAMPNGRFFNHAQKLFEIGAGSRWGVVFWGLGGIPGTSHRTLVASLSGEATLDMTTAQVAGLLAERFWAAFIDGYQLQRTRALDLLEKEKAGVEPTEEDKRDLAILFDLSGGFCVGGSGPSEGSSAFEFTYNIFLDKPPSPEPLPVGRPMFWGSPSLVTRLLVGVDEGLYDALLASPHWTGGPDELVKLVQPHVLVNPGFLPLRDAIDWVYSSILITIKALKFSHIAPICGGPIEVAVISTDRLFRWVRHKRMDAAIRDGLDQESWS